MSYIPKLLSFAAEQNLDGVNHVQVMHDGSCPFMTGGVCTCDPGISLIDDPFNKNRRQRRREKKEAKRGKKA